MKLNPSRSNTPARRQRSQSNQPTGRQRSQANRPARDSMLWLVLALCLAGAGCDSKKPAAPGAKGPTNAPAAQASGAGSGAAGKNAGAPSGSDAATSTNTVEFPKSVFVFDPAVVKDPFFPKTTRIKVKETAADAGKVAPLADIPSLLELTGILGFGTDRVAVVNNAMMEVGKRTTLTVVRDGRQQIVRVQCLQINRDSVVLRVDGEASPVVLRPKKKP